MNQDTRHGWIVCRNLLEIPVPDIGMLPNWAARGRLRPDDYVAHPVLEQCFLAREMPELKSIFRTKFSFWRLLA